MSTPAVWATAYVLLMSLTDFLLMGADKRRSRRQGARRVPERTFFLLALLGGSPGALAGMYLFRHKTRHWYFVLGMPAILILQAAAVVYILIR